MPSRFWGTFIARVALPAALPSLVTVVLAAALWQASPRDFVPLWTDEVMYWNESAAFMRGGFNAGYITVDERPAPAAFSHFGPHGIGYAMFYGYLGRLAGWQIDSQYIWHLVLVPVCAAAWFWVRRHRPSRLAETLLVATFWPLLLYLPTGMTEPINFGLAFLLAALLEQEAPTRANLVARAVCLGVGAFLRPTWAFILPALFLRRPSSWRRRAAIIVATGLLGLGSFVLQTWTSAPYPSTAWRAVAVSHPLASAAEILGRAASSARAFVTPHEEWFITLYRAEFLVGLIAMLIAMLALWWRRGPAGVGWRLETAAWLVLPVFAVQLAAADVESGRELRIMTPHALTALLLVAGGGGYRALVPAVAGLLVLPTLLTTYIEEHDGRFSRAPEARQFADAVQGKVTFDGSASSGWDNTLLMHAEALAPPTVGTPPGIGISFTLDWEDVASPPRSRYVLLREREPAAFSTKGLTPLVDVPGGTIYVRQRAQ